MFLDRVSTTSEESLLAQSGDGHDNPVWDGKLTHKTWEEAPTDEEMGVVDVASTVNAGWRDQMSDSEPGTLKMYVAVLKR